MKITLTSCICPMCFWNLPYLPLYPWSLVFLCLLPSLFPLLCRASDFLTSSPLVFLICIFLSFLTSFRFSITFSSYAHPFHFVLPFPFSLHISLFPQSSPSARYPRPKPNRKSENHWKLPIFFISSLGRLERVLRTKSIIY